MATIVTFVPRAAAARRPLPPGSTGSVVLFTGVRYEKAGSGATRETGCASDAGDEKTAKPN